MFGETTARIRAAVGDFAIAFDEDVLDVAGAQAMVREWSAIENTAAAIKALAAARVAKADAWDRTNGKSAADWLASETGTTAGRAKEQIDTGRKLRELDDTAAAAKRGELSPEQASAIADAAAVDPSAEGGLLETAKRGSLRDLRERCAATKARADADPDATRRRIHAGRRLRGWTDKDGVAHLHANGPVDLIARVKLALGPIAARLFDEARRAGRREDPAAYAFDALVELADDATAGATTRAGDGGGECDDDEAQDVASDKAHDRVCDTACGLASDADGRGDQPDAASLFDPAPVPRTTAADDPTARAGRGAEPTDPPAASRVSNGSDAGDGSTGSSTTPQRRPGQVPLRYRAVVRVDLEALVRGRVEGEETCEIAGLGPIPVSVARQLLGEATLHLVVTKGVHVANVTYLGRAPNAAQRIALLWQMPMCIVEACQRRAHLQYDHEKPFVETRHTRLDELSPKCDQHHYLRTHKGWDLVDGEGRRPMVPPDHPDHPKNRRTPGDADAA